MDTVTAVVGLLHQIRVRFTGHDMVKIENGVEAGLLANPLIYLPADFRLFVAPACIGDARYSGVARNNCGADNFDVSAGTHTFDQSLETTNHQIRRSAPPDVVRSHEQHDVRNAGMRKHVAVETYQAWI